MPTRVVTALLAVVLLLPGCHRGAQGPANDCGVLETNKKILAYARTNYLYPDTIPAGLDPAAFATPEVLLKAITANAAQAGKDLWSEVGPAKENGDLIQKGLEVGYGFTPVILTPQVYIGDVIADSPAGISGIRRGDEIIAMAVTRADLDAPESQTGAILASGALPERLGAPPPGAPFFLRMKSQAGALSDHALAAASHYVDPVPVQEVLAIGDRRVGYLVLRLFTLPAIPALDLAMARFRQEGVTDVVVDLRYNPGGEAGVAAHLGSLLYAGDPAATLFTFTYGPLSNRPPLTTRFTAFPNPLKPKRVAFITSVATASSSELVINTLEPYLKGNLAMVGDRTYGKPVGSEDYPVNSCGTVLNLMNIRVQNAQGVGDYFQGLPRAGFQGVTIHVPDALGNFLGDPNERWLGAALEWIRSGVDPGTPIPAPGM